MLHIAVCPHCENTVRVYCDNAPNPFQHIHFEHIVRLLNPRDKFPQLEAFPSAFAAQLKFMFLLHMLEGELPEAENLPEIPLSFSEYIDCADVPQVIHMLIQLMGRWDVLESSPFDG